MSQRTDEELIIIITRERLNYQPLAIEAAEKEVQKRSIDPKKIKLEEDNFYLESSILEHIQSNTTSFQNRVINKIIDSLAIMILIYFFNLFIILLALPKYDLSIINFLISYFGYYIYLEKKYQQTLGKFFTKTQVVKLNGDKPEFLTIVRRTCLRTIPYDIISFFFDGKVFHDTNSKTLVINLSDK